MGTERHAKSDKRRRDDANKFVNSLRNLVSNLKAREIVEFLNDLVNAPVNANPTSNINEGQKGKFSDLIFESRVGLKDLLQNPNAEGS
jgi:hypothetical protein